MNPEDETLPAQTSDAPRSVARPTDIPSAVGRFEIESKLGEGGMGVVLLATDPLLGRRVAIKVLRGANDASAKRRLLREAQGTAKLAHENVIVVHEVGEHHDQVYLAMEYIAGETLKRSQARRDWRGVLELYARAGRGLQAAHDAGLVHRDFKPDNVLVGTDGRLRVTDFGLVAATGEVPEPSARRDDSELSAKLTHTGAVLGTPRYMAPEQHRGEAVDARADQFAFCVALYEALYDQQPFAGTTHAELAENVVAGRLAPPPPSEIPDRVRDAVLRGLRRDREERYPSMRDLLVQLLVSPSRRRWPVALGLAIVAVAIAGGVFAITRSPDDEPKPAAVQAPAVATAPPPVVEAPVSTLEVFSLRPALGAFDDGELGFAAEKYDEAAQSYERAHTDLKVPQLLYNVGACFYMKGKRDGDVAAYRRATELYTQYLASDPIAPGVAAAVDAIRAEIARIEGGGARTPSGIHLDDPKPRGFVLLISNPAGATVYVDDPAKGPIGTTPWSGTLDGPHTIFIAKPGYTGIERTNDYHRSKLLVIQATLAPIETK